jgi:two-component system cell cycle sensor histidine kinase/response regulator CckA
VGIAEPLPESEELYRFLAENTHDAMSLYSLAGERVYANPAAHQMLGGPFRFTLEGVHPEDLDAVRANVQRIRAGEKTFITFRHSHADGSWRWLETWGALVHYQGEPHIMAVTRDVTERQRAAQQRAESERKLAEAQRVAHVGYWENDLVADRITWSDETYRILGLRKTEDAPSQAEFLARIHPDDLARHADVTRRAQQARERYDLEYRLVRPDGEIRIVHSVGEVKWDSDGKPLRAFGIVQDITDRKLAERGMLLFRSLVDHTTDSIQVIDADSGRIIDANLQAFTATGYTREEYLALRISDIAPAIGDRWPAIQRENQEAGTRVVETVHRRKDGTMFPVEVSIRHICLDREYVIAVARDISERKRVERALIESHSLLQAVIEGTSDAVFVSDLDGRYVMINPAGLRYFDRTVEEVLGRTNAELFGPELAEPTHARDRELLASETSQTYVEASNTRAVQRTFIKTKSVYRDAGGKVIGIVGIASDITELRRLEEQFRHAQKLEAVGRLAGGVAHDFNNLLMVINYCSDMVLDTLAAGDPNREMIADIRQAGEQAATLTGHLLAFSRKQVLQPRVVDVGAKLADVAKLLHRLIEKDVTFSLTATDDLGRVKIDPGQFEQAIVNLAVNARDAMPTGGQLSIETRNVELSAADAERIPDARAGRYIVVAVHDTGHGMSEETRARIFEPFFTTKEPGRGTGLGLAMVYGFVTQSGGHLVVHSAEGQGTTFEIYLPRVEEIAPVEDVADVMTIPTGTETVLLVEDDDAVRSVSRRILESVGYTVLEATDGHAAIEVASKHPWIDLLVADQVMPRMGGRQLATLLVQRRPELRVIIMSGYPEPSVAGGSAGVFLQKPFSAGTLARTVRELLDDPAHA